MCLNSRRDCHIHERFRSPSEKSFPRKMDSRKTDCLSRAVYLIMRNDRQNIDMEWSMVNGEQRKVKIQHEKRITYVISLLKVSKQATYSSNFQLLRKD
jgi:hypothetical protein